MADYELFHWSDDFSVGIQEVDNQHKMLFELINRIFVVALRREHRGSMSEIIDTLINYTRTHFVLEEQLLRAAGYPGLATHMLEHGRFIERMESVARKYLQEDKVVTFELMNFLKHWLKEHILETDMAYADAIARAGFSTDQWSAHARHVVEHNNERLAQRPWWKFWVAPSIQAGGQPG